MAHELDAGSPDALEELRVNIRRQGPLAVVEVSGEWDIVGAPAAQRAIAAVLAARPERLVLDLSRLTFIDASGVHMTLELAREATEKHIRLTIIRGSRRVHRPFEICHLDERLPFV